MLANKITIERMLVLLYGVFWGIVVGFQNASAEISGSDYSIVDVVTIFIVNLLVVSFPNILFFVFTIKLKKLALSLIPAISICIVQSIGIGKYYLLFSSTSGVIIISYSVFAVVAGLIATFLIFILKLVKKSNPTK